MENGENSDCKDWPREHHLTNQGKKALISKQITHLKEEECDKKSNFEDNKACKAFKNYETKDFEGWLPWTETASRQTTTILLIKNLRQYSMQY